MDAQPITTRQPGLPVSRWILLSALTNLLLLVVSMLVSVQFRVTLRAGQALGADYVAHTPLTYGLLALSLAGAYLLATILQQANQSHLLSVERQFRVYLVALVTNVFLILVLQPDISRLQMIYYLFFGAALGVGVILVPGRLRTSSPKQLNILDNLRDTWKQRHLLSVWTRFRIQSRYTETKLGILWIMLLPIAQATVLSFAFTYLLGARTTDVPFISFLLSGQIVFGVFQYMTMRSVSIMETMMGVISQVYFPREVIPIMLLGEALIDFCFAFVAFMALSTLNGVPPNIYYVYIPIPILIVALMSLGLSLILSWMGLLVRDLQQALGVVVQFLFYATVLFRVDVAPASFQIILLFNPLSATTEAFRDIVLYSRPPAISTLFFPLVVALSLVYTGYVMFKVNEDRFVDFT